ncbi:unnamed protein product [Chironomus riparius]|uniref:Nucleolar 27S pre-rRNA processing Urb2/Npa2 C-terminal domain-containing protein n=1 Tax=Chironomus riparius TaxID=315576 RepID=A0A9N9RZJ9_9DIPT|nr:unnamed protein product [Chironomus riparius]
MDLENELLNYIKNSLNGSPESSVKFLIKSWNSSLLDTNVKYEIILRNFEKTFLNQLLTAKNYDLIKECLDLKFPQSSVSNNVIKSVLNSVKSILKDQTTESIECCTTIMLNESYKEYFKQNLTTYSKFIGSTLTSFDEIKCNKYEIIDYIVRELHYFANLNDFSKQFRQNVLLQLYKAANKTDNVNSMWNLIKSIFFSRSLSLNEDSDDESIKIFSDKEVTYEQMEVLIESFIISFKSDSLKIVKFLNHFNENVLSKYESNNDEYLIHVKMLYTILKKHDIEIAALKKLESTFESFSLQIIDRVESSINEMNLCEYFQVLSTIIAYDPFIFVDNNMIYKLIAECMMKEKCEEDMSSYELLLSTVVKIFGKDIYQFIKKLLSAISLKLVDFEIPKKRKRKNSIEPKGSAKKKMKLNDGCPASVESFHITNIWPNSIKTLFDEIFADINVNQTTKLWKYLNDCLRDIISNLKDSIDENILFKIDFISSLICQLVTSSRIHEHLVYKSSEISDIIDDFNDVQHNFYETIIEIEYNNRIMNAFLKMSYDYENFIMMYFYHYDEEVKSELDPIFIADKSRIKSSEWKIIQQRINNFGKTEEKSYSNLLMLQHLIKGKLFKISNHDDDKDFLQTLLINKEQINLLLDQKHIRLHIFNLLNDESAVTDLIDILYSKINDDKEKLSIVLSIAKNNSKMLESLTSLMLKNNDINDSIEVIKTLPIAYMTQEIKKMIIQKLLLDTKAGTTDENCFDLIITFNKIFKNDGYKNFFKDFTLISLIESLSDINTFKTVYEMIFRTSVKKMSADVLSNLEWILKESKNNELIEILATTMCDINLSATNECSIDKINNFKLEVIDNLSSKLNIQNIVKEQRLFCIFSRLCSQNMQIVKDETKEHHLNLLNKLLGSMAKSTAADNTIELFMLALKDAKKLNLNDEIKGGIVKALTKHLRNVIEDKMLKAEENEKKSNNVDREKDLITTLSSFKSNCREECSQFLHKLLNGKDAVVTDKQLIYSFMIYEILFENCEKNEKKENTTLVKSYMKHCDNLVMVRGKITETDLLCSIYSTHISMMKCYKEKLNFLIIDDIFNFHIDQRHQPASESVEDFCKFYDSVGQFLFVLGNFQQNYFKSRIPQYFKAYNKFLEAIYFYKADDKEQFDAKESSMLLRLTLQLENIMKMLMKLHSNSFSIISPYIVSSIVNVFIKNPKMLNVGDKFKVNIKNICYQLLSTFDDKTRKHICAVVDESTRDVYDNLFLEFKRK